MSIQRTRGSRRNHRSWRTANWRVRAMIARPPRRVDVRRRGGRAAPCSRAPGAPCGETARDSREPPHLVEQPGGDHPMHALLDALGQRRPGQRRPIIERRPAGRSSTPGPNELNGRPLPRRDLEGPHDAARVGRFHRGWRRRGSSCAQLGVRAVGVSGARLELGPHVGPVPGISIGRDGAGGTARCRRRAARRPRAIDADRGVVRPRWKSVTVNVVASGRRGRGSDGHRGSIGRRGLGRADVHAAVHLHGVDGHDLGAGDRRRGGHGHVALARRRRAEDDERGACGSTSAGEHGDATLVAGSARSSTNSAASGGAARRR